jgi:hypothetical protein
LGNPGGGSQVLRRRRRQVSRAWRGAHLVGVVAFIEILVNRRDAEIISRAVLDIWFLFH